MFTHARRKKFQAFLVGEATPYLKGKEGAIRRVVVLSAILISSSYCNYAHRYHFSPLCNGISRRGYTPIFTVPPPAVKFSDLHCSEEVRTLWAPSSSSSSGIGTGCSSSGSSSSTNPSQSASIEASLFPISSLDDGVRWWIRFGNNPVVHASLPTRLHPASSSSFRSPFAYVEDYVGTHLVPSLECAGLPCRHPHTSLSSVSPSHLEESIQFWMRYFEHRSAARLRQARRTAVHHVGVTSSTSSFQTQGGSSGHSKSGSISGKGGNQGGVEVSGKHVFGVGEEGSAPIWVDEADQPYTRWDQDTSFMESSYLAERHLKKKANTLLQLEQYIWFPTGRNNNTNAQISKEEVETMTSRFLSFLDAMQEQRPPYLPLPIPSVWFYEGETREKWAHRYLSASAESYHYFQNVLSLFVNKGNSPKVAQKALLKTIAKQMEKIHEVLIRRFRRQITALVECEAKGKDLNQITPSLLMSIALHHWCEKETERFQRSVEDGEFDSEDLLEENMEAWNEEHRLIQALAEEPLLTYTAEGTHRIDGGKDDHLPPSSSLLSVCFLDFWKHTMRREELETLHVLTDNGLRALTAGSRAALLMEIPYEKVLSQLAASVQEGKLDMRAAVFCPHFNTSWCKWHYAKFGGSSIAQHTHAAKRRLHYHYAASAEDVAATAALHYATKPMSSAVDYATPYTFRRSLVKLCAAYGVDRMRAIQRPVLSSAAYLAAAEDAIRIVCAAAGIPHGKHRRAYDRRTRNIAVHGAQLLPAVSNVEVRDCVSELECTESEEEEALKNLKLGGLPSSVRVLPKKENNDPSAQSQMIRWPLGGRKAVAFDWPHPAVTALRLTREAGPYTAERVVLLDQLRNAGRVEITLWRRRQRQAEADGRHHTANNGSGLLPPQDGRSTAASGEGEEGTEQSLGMIRNERSLEEEARELLRSSPALREIHQYASRVYHRLQGKFMRLHDNMGSKEGGESSPISTASTGSELEQEYREEEEEEKNWVFVCALNDNLPLQEEGIGIVQLPFVASPWASENRSGSERKGEGSLPVGVYRLRVRCFDQRLHPGGASSFSIGNAGSSHPGLCSDGYSAPFEVYDAVTPVLEKFVKKEKPKSPTVSSGAWASAALEREKKREVIPGSALLMVCRALRKAKVEVSLQTEFEAGQVLTTEGDVFVDRFVSLLYQSASRARGSNSSHWWLGTGAEGKDGQAVTQYVGTPSSALIVGEGGVTTMRDIIEIRAETHWRLFHPGATPAEWASARYDVMIRALTMEREWWWKDHLLRDAAPLTAVGVVPGLVDSADFANCAAIHRYGVELCSLLTAVGQSYPRDPPVLIPYYRESYEGALLQPQCSTTLAEGEVDLASREVRGSTRTSMSVSGAGPAVVSSHCRVNGRGEIEALGWHQIICPVSSSLSSSSSLTHSVFLSSPPLSSTQSLVGGGRMPATATVTTSETAITSSSLEEVLALAQDAVRAAQDRHATLTMTKMGPLEREVQVQSFCGLDGLEMGGKYGRTYCYAVEKAKQAIEDEYGVAGRIITGVREGEDAERVSDGMAVDRFASSTHPEQRLTRFTHRTTMSGQNIEDPTPDQESTWGR